MKGKPETSDTKKVDWVLDGGSPTFDKTQGSSVALQDLDQPFVKTEGERKKNVTATYVGKKGCVNSKEVKKDLKLVKLDFLVNNTDVNTDDAVITYPDAAAQAAATKKVLHWIPVKITHSQTSDLELKFESSGSDLYFHNGGDPNPMTADPTLNTTLTASFADGAIIYVGAKAVGSGSATMKVQGKLPGVADFKDAPEDKPYIRS